MVKLSRSDHEAVTQAITCAETQTSAEIACVIAQTSDAYLAVKLLYGMAFGGFAAILLTQTAALPIGVLLWVQTVLSIAFALLPTKWCAILIPKRMRQHRAAHRAMEEYWRVEQHVHHATPLVLVYISLAERYAHILPNPVVREIVDVAPWQQAIARFGYTMRTQDLRAACLKMMEEIAVTLAPPFPFRGEAHVLQDDVIERER